VFKQKSAKIKAYIFKNRAYLISILLLFSVVLVVFNFISFIFVLYSVILFLLFIHLLLEILFDIIIESIFSLQPISCLLISLPLIILIYIWFWLLTNSPLGKALLKFLLQS